MKEIKTVSIVGMGALGMLYGDIITRKLGKEAAVFVMDDDRYDRHKDDVYTVNGEVRDFVKVRAKDAKPCDLLIVAVKDTGLAAALDTMESSVGEDTLIVPVLNGITSEQIIGERYGMDKVIHTVAQGMDAMHFGNGLQYTVTGKLRIGIVDPAMQEKLDRLCRYFDRSGVPYRTETDILYRLWSKFMVNVGINQTCMVYNTTYSGAMEPGSLAYMTLISAMREVSLLAELEGVKLGEKELKKYISILHTFAPDATPSMGQDRINKKPSEVEMFAGTVIRMAKKHDLAVPTNEYLYKRVKEIEAEY